MRLARTVRALLAPTLVAVTAGGVVAAVATAAPAVAAPAAASAPAAAAAVAPGKSNTGPKPGVALKRVDGLLVLNRAGATYSGLDIHGRVRVAAPNITLANSIVRGDASKTYAGIIDCNHAGYDHRGFTVRDSLVYAQYPSVYQVGIMGHDFTVLRTEITNTVDAVHVVGGNVTVTRSWLHDTHFIPASQSPKGHYTHNDGVQVVSGGNVTISQNTIERNHNAALQVTQDEGATWGVKFTDNWSSGGGCTVNITPQPRPSIGGMTITSNRFKHDTRVPNCAIVLNHGVSMAQSGNVWSDTGKAVTLSRGA